MQVTFKGSPLTLVGTPVTVGAAFPDFTVTGNDLSPVSLADTQGVRIILTVPSVDTPTCETEVVTFNKRASEIPGVSVYTVSLDLPFAQSRFCGAQGIDAVRTVSDYKDHSFGKATGTYIAELGLLARAAFVVNAAGTVVHVEYVRETAEQPDYDAILAAAKNA